jgi:hypothetical protein
MSKSAHRNLRFAALVLLAAAAAWPRHSDRTVAVDAGAAQAELRAPRVAHTAGARELAMSPRRSAYRPD